MRFYWLPFQDGLLRNSIIKQIGLAWKSSSLDFTLRSLYECPEIQDSATRCLQCYTQASLR